MGMGKLTQGYHANRDVDAPEEAHKNQSDGDSDDRASLQTC